MTQTSTSQRVVYLMIHLRGDSAHDIAFSAASFWTKDVFSETLTNEAFISFKGTLIDTQYNIYNFYLKQAL